MNLTKIKMESRYQLWLKDKPVSELTIEVITAKITEIIIGLNNFYGLVGITEQEVLNLHQFIHSFLKKYPRFKLIDIDRSLELFKKRPDLNKLTPEFFETIFDKYRKSDERKLILHTWENDLEAHKNELTEGKKEYSPSELLNACRENYRNTKQINLNSGKVYELNYKLIEEKIGLEKLKELREQTQEKLIADFEHAVKHLKKGSIRDEHEYQLSLIKKGQGLLKVETRKSHLKYLFSIMEFELQTA